MNKKKLPIGLLSFLMVMGTGISSFAAEGGQAEAVSGALQTVATDVLASIGTIAPVALSIAGAFLVWKYGMRFFKSISK